jgi:hypothetical protein
MVIWSFVLVCCTKKNLATLAGVSLSAGIGENLDPIDFAEFFFSVSRFFLKRFISMHR